MFLLVFVPTLEFLSRRDGQNSWVYNPGQNSWDTLYLRLKFSLNNSINSKITGYSSTPPLPQSMLRNDLRQKLNNDNDLTFKPTLNGGAGVSACLAPCRKKNG